MRGRGAPAVGRRGHGEAGVQTARRRPDPGGAAPGEELGGGGVSMMGMAQMRPLAAGLRLLTTQDRGSDQRREEPGEGMERKRRSAHLSN